MNELIKYFNKKYGKEYGKISYPRTTIQIYQVYQIIKDCNIEDNELTDLLHHVKLPKPKTMEAKKIIIVLGATGALLPEAASTNIK